MKNNRILIMVAVLVMLLGVNVLIILFSSSDPGDGLPPAHEEEPILALESELRVTPDGGIFVTEQVKVKSVGKNLKRGITRQLPTSFLNTTKQAQAVTYELVSVMRNGETIAIAEPQKEAQWITYYLGEADKYLTPGIYHYIFQYIMQGRIEQVEKQKVINFDVTGTPLFPIYQASATLRIPEKLGQEYFSFQGYIVKPGQRNVPEQKTKEGVSTSFSFDDGKIDPAQRDFPVIKLWTTRRLEPLERFEIEVRWAAE